MKIIIKYDNRLLIKDDKTEININDGVIVKYTGIYYKKSKPLMFNISFNLAKTGF